MPSRITYWSSTTGRTTAPTNSNANAPAPRPFLIPYPHPYLYGGYTMSFRPPYNPPLYGVPGPPPPPYVPSGYQPGARTNAPNDAGPYNTPDVPRLTVHAFRCPLNSSSDVFFPGNGRVDTSKFKAHKIPLIYTVKQFFEQLDADAHGAVVEEAVEEGNGIWTRGTKLIHGVGRAEMTLGEMKWRVNGGLGPVKGEPVFVLVRGREGRDQ